MTRQGLERWEYVQTQREAGKDDEYIAYKLKMKKESLWVWLSRNKKKFQSSEIIDINKSLITEPILNTSPVEQKKSPPATSSMGTWSLPTLLLTCLIRNGVATIAGITGRA